jgi:hypothetical protein
MAVDRRGRRVAVEGEEQACVHVHTVFVQAKKVHVYDGLDDKW